MILWGIITLYGNFWKKSVRGWVLTVRVMLKVKN